MVPPEQPDPQQPDPQQPDPRRNDHPRQTDRMLERQRFANALIQTLPEALSDGEGAIITWIGRLALVNTDVDVWYPAHDVLALFEAQGYHTALAPTRATYPQEHPAISHDPPALANWLIGQALWDLRACGVLDASALVWARHYLALRTHTSPTHTAHAIDDAHSAV